MRKRSICFGGFRKTRRRRRLNSSSACSMKRRLRWRRTARSYAESKRGSAHCAPNMGAPMRQSLARNAPNGRHSLKRRALSLRMRKKRRRRRKRRAKRRSRRRRRTPRRCAIPKRALRKRALNAAQAQNAGQLLQQLDARCTRLQREWDALEAPDEARLETLRARLAECEAQRNTAQTQLGQARNAALQADQALHAAREGVQKESALLNQFT